jgi:CheY-like chemotaxis protein
MDRLTVIDPSIKAIVMSGYAQDTAITDFRDCGFQAAITKPFTLQELSSVLQSVMAMRTYPVH